MRFRINEHPDIDFQMNAAGLDLLIARLGEERAKMGPPHNDGKNPRPDGADYAGPMNPSMAVSHRGGEVVLHVNDPRFGWLHFFMNGDRPAALAGYLKIEAARIAPPIAGLHPIN